MITVHARLAETPESGSLEFQLYATFADNFAHIFRQIILIVYYYKQFYHVTKIEGKMEYSRNSISQNPGFLHALFLQFLDMIHLLVFINVFYHGFLLIIYY